MRRSKNRGTKRKLRKIEQHLIDATNAFPMHLYEGIYSIKLPANRQFIERLNQKGLKCISSYLMDCALNLKQMKPSAAHKIVILLFPENYWRSELIIFQNEAVYKDFFDRHSTWGFWREIKNPTESFASIHWKRKMYVENIDDEDEQLEQMFICYIER